MALAVSLFAGASLRADEPTGDLPRAVSSLPEASLEQRLKKAVLTWALEDADADLKDGSAEHSRVTLQDVKALLDRPFAAARPAPENLFPRRPAVQIARPLDDATVQKILKENKQFSKNPEMAGENFNGLRTGYAGEGLAMSLCHPDSSRAGDPVLVIPLLRRMEAMYSALTPKSRILADFGPAPAMAQIYMLVNNVYPDLILPSRKVEWEAGLRRNADAIVALREKTFTECKLGSSYVNADVKYITALAYSSIIFNEPKYLRLAEAGVRLQATALYPDGAFAYIGWQNEEPTYHGIALAELTRLWQVTGNELAIDLVRKSYNYQRLCFDPRWGPAGERWGVMECSTPPSWKQNWNGWGPDGEDLVAQLAGKPVTTPQNSPDNYFVYDRNIDGPRARFGMFSFTGNGRDYHTESRGKNTYAGCLVMYPKGESLPAGAFDRAPLSGGLAGASTEVQFRAGEPDYRQNIYSLAREEHNATMVAQAVASLSTVHRLSVYNGSPTAWEGQQAWLYTPQRIVGLVAVEAKEDAKAMNLTGVIRLVTFRAGPQLVEPDGDIIGAFKYGHLRVRIHAFDYTNFGMDVKQPYSPRPKFNSFSRIVLSDEPIEQRLTIPAKTYPKGAKHFYLVEARPEWSSPAEKVTKLDVGQGLAGFEVVEGDRTYRLIQNLTGGELQARLDATTDSELHRSGEQYRPAWIEDDGLEKASGTPQQVSGPVSTPVPAYAHLVLIGKH